MVPVFKTKSTFRGFPGSLGDDANLGVCQCLVCFFALGLTSFQSPPGPLHRQLRLAKTPTNLLNLTFCFAIAIQPHGRPGTLSGGVHPCRKVPYSVPREV